MPIAELDPKERERRRKKLRTQAETIRKRAREKGLETNFFFTNTFNTYLTQLDLLDVLEEAIRAEGTLITKEYVKGRENLCVNPAISEFNKTASAANGTVSTLINILKAFDAGEQDDAGSKLDKLRAAMEKQPDR